MYGAYHALHIERRNSVLVIRINNPPTNTISQRAHTELSRIFFDINRDAETKVVVIAAVGDSAFCGGGDIEEARRRIETADHAAWLAVAAEGRAIVQGLLQLERPLIARIHGDAMGLGATLATFADFSYMLAEARIADVHVKVGLAAGDGGALTWPLLVGFPRARRYLMTGDALTGREAANIGLVSECCDSVQDLDAKVEAMAARLCAGATLAINATKVSINLVLRNMLESLVDKHMAQETATYLSRDHRAAIVAYSRGELPDFTGE